MTTSPTAAPNTICVIESKFFIFDAPNLKQSFGLIVDAF